MQKIDFELLFPAYPETSTLLIGSTRADYSSSAIARAVEDCGAHLLNLNITSMEDEEWPVVVWLRIDRLNPEPVARSLERYGYGVIDYDNRFEPALEDMQRRTLEFLRYIDV